MTGAELMEWQLADFADDSALWGFDAIHLPASWLALVKSSRPINEGSAVAMQWRTDSAPKRCMRKYTPGDFALKTSVDQLF